MTYLHVEAVEDMIKNWQQDCADHPAIYNQGNVLRDRLDKLTADIETPITWIDVSAWSVWKNHAIPVDVAEYIAGKVNSLLAATDGGQKPEQREVALQPVDERVAQAVSPIPGEGWQPIDENTPRDGTDILVWMQTEGAEMQQVVHWDDMSKDDWRWQVTDGPNYHRDMFTHWMPLPASPLHKGEKAE